MSSGLLKVDDLTLTTRNGFIVHNLSFEINRGEIVALTGKSGSGKTSIALALLGLLPNGIQQSSGTFRFFKDDGTSVHYPKDLIQWQSLRGTHIGYLQQDVFGAFNPVLRIGQQMLMIIKERTLQKKSGHETELKSIMAETGLTDIERIWNSFPHQLSGGQLQRCLLCICLVIRPSVIIADEPTSAIDKSNQVDLLDVFAWIRKKYNMAILCITHDKTIVQYLADREITLDMNEYTSVMHPNAIIRNRSDKGYLLSVENLGYVHRFGGLAGKRGAVIKGITFNLSAGQCLGIIGESGSGKSTLAQMLVGLLIPSEGNIVVDGRTIDFMLEDDIILLRTKIQLVMQDGKGSLHPYKLISELMEEVIREQKKMLPDFNPDLLQSLAEVGLPGHVLDRKAGSLSGGECLRVSIARALLINPEILVCDESTSALDTFTKNGIIDLFTSLLQHRNLAMILISHDDAIISNLADDLIVFSDGQIVEMGPSAEILTAPKHPVTKKLVFAETTLSKKANI